MAAVIIHSDFEDQENKVCYCIHFFLIYLHEVMEPESIILVFAEFSASFLTLLFHLHQEAV